MSLWSGLVCFVILSIAFNVQVGALKLTTPYNLANHVRRLNTKPPVIVVVDVNKKSKGPNNNHGSGHYHSDGNFYEHGEKKSNYRLLNDVEEYKANRNESYYHKLYKKTKREDKRADYRGENYNDVDGTGYKNIGELYSILHHYSKVNTAIDKPIYKSGKRYSSNYKSYADKSNIERSLVDIFLKLLLKTKEAKSSRKPEYRNKLIFNKLRSNIYEDEEISKANEVREMKKAHLLKHILMAAPDRLSNEKLTIPMLRDAITSYKNCVLDSKSLRGAIVCFPKSDKSCTDPKHESHHGNGKKKQYTDDPNLNWGDCYDNHKNDCEKKKTKGPRGTGRTMPPELKNKILYSD